MTIAPTSPHSQQFATHSFHAMGTDIELLMDAPDDDLSREAFADAEREIRRFEQMFSRFDPTSEISRLNKAGAMVVSVEVQEVIELALGARAATGGRFDPLIGSDLEAAGYDRSFDDFERDERGVAHAGGEASQTVVMLFGCQRNFARDAHPQVHVYPGSGFVSLPAGVKIDLGGIAKGWITQCVCEQLAQVAPALVNAGGDIFCTPRAGTEGWPVAIPMSTKESITIELPYGALATSGTDRRYWIDRASGARRNHLIDPATHTSTKSDATRVTVVAGDATVAEVWAKALLLSGVEAAASEAQARGVTAVIVASDGTATMTGDLAA